jgi:hypothetical protein
MTNTIFIKAAIVSVLYTLIRFFEMRFILKKNQPLKKLTRDGLIVYFSVIGADFIYNQVNPLSAQLNSKPIAFTNQPDF